MDFKLVGKKICVKKKKKRKKEMDIQAIVGSHVTY